MFERRRLELELARWRRAGHKVQLWWRDDDAQKLTPGLARLIVQCERMGAPLTLAVVPVGSDPELAAYVNRYPMVSVVQHGVDHCNARGAKTPSQFEDAAPVEKVAASIQAGASLLKDFNNALPIYVPPWNAVQSNVLAALEWLSMDGLSAHGRPRSPAAPARIDVHLDVMRWGDRPRFRGHERIFGRMRRLMRDRRRTECWAEPIGLLTHHLDHDAATWNFLDAFLIWQPLRDAAQWRSASELFAVSPSGLGESIPQVYDIGAVSSAAPGALAPARDHGGGAETMFA